MLSTFIKLPFDLKIFVLSIFEWLLYTGFTVYMKFKTSLKSMARNENNLVEMVNKHNSMPQVKIYQRSHKASKFLFAFTVLITWNWSLF